MTHQETAMPDPMSAIDKIIAEAQEEGRFNDLPGKELRSETARTRAGIGRSP